MWEDNDATPANPATLLLLGIGLRAAFRAGVPACRPIVAPPFSTEVGSNPRELATAPSSSPTSMTVHFMKLSCILRRYSNSS